MQATIEYNKHFFIVSHSVFGLAGSGGWEYNAPIGGAQGHLMNQKAQLNLRGSECMAWCQEHSQDSLASTAS